MKIEKINENKIKITLDVNDLTTHHIDAKSFIYNTPESQDLFWDVMKEAEKKFGFSVDESMVYVEAHVNNTGVFTLIVTKSSVENTITPKARKRGSNYTLKRKAENHDSSSYLYRFNDLKSLVEFCKVTPSLTTDTSVLYSLGNNYYLQTRQEIADIIEFAYKENVSPYLVSKIKEYGKVLYETNAINIIKSL